MRSKVTGGLLILVAATLVAGDAKAAPRDFAARLTPVKDVLPADSEARGTATFRLSSDGTQLEYEVTVTGVDAVSQIHLHLGKDARTTEGAHYHLGPEEADGPIVVFLMHFAPQGVAADGVVASGTLTQVELTGSLSRRPFAVLIDHMRTGGAYVNAHVLKRFETGDVFCCPSGLRGAIRPAGP